MQECMFSKRIVNSQMQLRQGAFVLVHLEDDMERLFEKNPQAESFPAAENLKSKGGISQRTPHYFFPNAG